MPRFFTSCVILGSNDDARCIRDVELAGKILILVDIIDTEAQACR